MNREELYILKGKIIISISFVFLLLSIILCFIQNTNLSKEDYNFLIETIDIKQMATVKVAIKESKNKGNTNSIVSTESSKPRNFKEVALVNMNNKEENNPVPEQIPTPTAPTWRLPTEQGYITQYAHYGHIALDITSARGTNERIYPIADGVITGIFYDTAGAKIVTVNHYINGQYYTSQYVHLSWYAPDIYVGKQVTTNDALGGMGATGIATGIHLHITVLDCNLFDPNDANCSTLNGFYRYGHARLNQGFYGLTNLMEVPYRWYTR